MIYIYALTDSQTLPSVSREGIGGRPLFLHSKEDLAAICSKHDQTTVQPDGRNILTHERIIEACMEVGAVLPARFGTCFDNLDRLDAILEQNCPALREGLDRVRGCVEMGVRVLGPEVLSEESVSKLPPASSGRQYLVQRAQVERTRLDAQSKAGRWAEELHAQFAREAIDGSMRALTASPLHLTGAYLVQRDQIDRFQQRVRDIATLHPDLRMLGTGPWPPYHFSPRLKLSTAEVCHA